MFVLFIPNRYPTNEPHVFCIFHTDVICNASGSLHAAGTTTTLRMDAFDSRDRVDVNGVLPWHDDIVADMGQNCRLLWTQNCSVYDVILDDL